MKAKIIITPKKAVLDPQGLTVQRALQQMGYSAISEAHIGKYIELELDETDSETARSKVDEACRRFLSNPVIEEYSFELES